MQNILVFGAGGYLGIPICIKLTALGFKVTAVDTQWFAKGPSARHVHRSIVADTRTVEKDVFIGQDAVIDVAGISNDASAELDPDMTGNINVFGAMRIAMMAREAGVRRYVYSSSTSVYGHGAHDRLTEDAPLNPLTAYAKSKVTVENGLLDMQNDAFQPVLLRNSTVFGMAPRMRFDLVVNRMTAEAWKKKGVTVEGGGLQRRPLLHVADAVHVFSRALEHDFEPGIYNVGSNRMNFRILDIAEQIGEDTDTPVAIEKTESPDRRDYHVCFDRVEKYINNPISIGQGVVQIWHALENGRLHVDDPTTHTLNWYKHLMKLNGGPL